jgi:hypothetical protein
VGVTASLPSLIQLARHCGILNILQSCRPPRPVTQLAFINVQCKHLMMPENCPLVEGSKFINLAFTWALEIILALLFTGLKWNKDHSCWGHNWPFLPALDDRCWWYVRETEVLGRNLCSAIISRSRTWLDPGSNLHLLNGKLVAICLGYGTAILALALSTKILNRYLQIFFFYLPSALQWSNN